MKQNISSSPKADAAHQQKHLIRKGLNVSNKKSEINGLPYLQRTLGNRAVQRLFQQDSFQQDNNQMAIRGSVLQAKLFPGNVPTVGEVDQDTLRSIPQGVGRPLDTATKQVLERGFDTHLDSVRVHDDSSTQAFVRIASRLRRHLRPEYLSRPGHLSPRFAGYFPHSRPRGRSHHSTAQCNIHRPDRRLGSVPEFGASGRRG